MVKAMDDEPGSGSPRTVKVAVAGALGLGAALVGIGVGGMAGVDRQLQAATPKQGQTRVVSEGDAKRGDCPAAKPRPKQSRKL